MISTQYPARQMKTGPIATTYRAGKDIFGTCPASCKLCSDPASAAERIDHDYMTAVYNAVPTGGTSFTYSHFHHRQWSKRYPAKKGKTTINYSADTMRAARAALAAGVPTVVATTEREYNQAKKRGDKIKLCPADKSAGRTCANCGGNKGPICSWQFRDFVIAFLAHGTKAKQAADPKQNGGCYAEAGYHTRIHWNWLANQKSVLRDPEKIEAFASGLPYGTTLRHHISGDFGLF